MVCECLMRVFLWKNFKRMRHYYKTTILTLVMPIVLTFLIYWFSNKQEPGSFGSSKVDINLEDKGVDLSTLTDYWKQEKILFAPNGAEFLKLVADLKGAVGHENAIELEKSLKINYNMAPAVLFNMKNTKSLHIDARGINNLQSLYMGSFGQLGLSGSSAFEHDSPNYAQQYMMNYFSRQFIKDRSNDGKLLSCTIQPAPIKAIEIGFKSTLSPKHLFWILLAIAVMISHTLIVMPLVEEKQDGIKELLSIATSYSYLNLVSILLMDFIILVLIYLACLIIAYAYPTFYNMSMVHPIILSVLFLSSFIAYCTFVTAFFDTVTYASLCSILLIAAPSVPFLYISNPFMRNFQVLAPISMFMNSFVIYGGYTEAGRIFDSSQLTVNQHPNNTGFSMLSIYLWFLFTTCLYYLLYYYISSVFPGIRGTPKPYNFLFTKEHWMGPQKSNEPDTEAATGSQSFVQVQNLTKRFRRSLLSFKTFTAVNNISFNLQERLITVLLGHNGAGKTTTMSMMTGIVAPTSGRIIVDGNDDVNDYRTLIGYCPQLDVFIGYMNSLDHLIFFGQLRGLLYIEAVEEANYILEKVKLTGAINTPAKSFSSGMKRRLCLACAVVGQTKLVILDEPSAGLDPESRRDLWDVLLPLRKMRTILLTTHSMEEADVLGDKVIIMDHGTIIGEGTQLQLKRRYGSGYHLKILISEAFLYAQTLKIIQTKIPDAKVKTLIHPTLSISLPYTAISLFPALLSELESKRSELGFESLSVANTTMEEVFINSASKNTDPYKNTASGTNDVNMATVHLFKLWYRQFGGIWYKKSVFMYRSWIKFLLHFLLPFVFILLTYLTSKSNAAGGSSAKFGSDEIKASYIKNANVYLAVGTTVPKRTTFIDIFQKLAKNDRTNAIIIEDKSLFQAMLDKLETDRFNYLDKTLSAIEVTGDDTSGYKLKLIHQPYLTLSAYYTINLANKMMANILIDDNIELTYSIGRLKNLEEIQTQILATFSFTYYINVPFAFFMFILFFISLVFIEESSGFMLIQNISPAVFWLATYSYDCCIVILCSAFYAAISMAFESAAKPKPVEGVEEIIDSTKTFTSKQIGSHLFLVFMLGGISLVLCFYLLVKIIMKLTTIYTVAIIFEFLSAVVALSIILVRVPNKILMLFCRLLPNCAVRYGMLYTLVTPDSSKLSVLYKTIVIEIILLIAFLILIFEDVYISTCFWNTLAFLNPVRFCCKNRTQEYIDDFQPDSSVAQETDRVHEIMLSTARDYPLVVSELKKDFGNFHAVKGVNFFVEKGECFGLLGMNGAGKSTVFKMMTLNSAITKGKITANGYSSRRNRYKYQRQFGYCPEMSALLNFMTAYQMLRYMAWIKGTPFEKHDVEAKAWLKRMDLVGFSNVVIEDYSGGTKRKLNTAMSMIGYPSLIFMDEPTAGVDPMSRRYMWSCIKDFQAKLKTVVLTSHSMDECEELCNRLAIMNVGQFKCIGYIQKLKAIFGKGFTLLIKLKNDTPPRSVNPLKTEILQVYQCTLRDDHAGTLVYNVSEKNIIWSEIFQKTESFCKKYSEIVEDYAINEISLEDIFLQFKNSSQNAT